MSAAGPERQQILGDRVKTLEDEFFRREDERLVQRLRELKEKENSREALTRASGITNTAVLDSLLGLGVRPEIMGALSLVPLAEVAWADGALDPKEKQTIIQHAEAAGVKPGSTAHDLLESWLERRPEAKLLTAWIRMVEGLAEQMTPEQAAALRAELLDRARSVARASGGILGMGSVSTAEADMLRQLEAAFRTS
jgi:hypothetical protein